MSIASPTKQPSGDAIDPASDVPEHAPPRNELRRQLRGSSLLLGGRMFSLCVNFLVQILIVRSLTQEHYGAFASGMSLALVCQSLVSMGMGQAVGRFVPLYQEQQRPDKMFSMLLFVVGLCAAVSMLLLIGLWTVLYHWPLLLVGNLQSARIAGMLLLLAPILAFDELILAMFAAFSAARQIFLRKYVVTPLFRLLVVGATIYLGGNVYVLAIGYMLVAIAGNLIFTSVVIRLLRREGVLSQLSFRWRELPWREVLPFSLAVLSTDLVFVVMTAVDTLLLQFYHGNAQVALVHAVEPAARTNHLVLYSFAMLFAPMMTRLSTRGDRESMADAYWQTAAWVSLLGFPFLAVTVPLAEPTTQFLFGSRYAESAGILAIMALGYFAIAAAGFNDITLKMAGALRYLVVANVVAVVVNLTCGIALVMLWGAWGAALSTALTMLVYSMAKQLGVRLGAGIPLLPRCKTVFISIAVATLGLAAMQQLFQPPLWIGVPIAGVVSLGLLRVNRHTLQAAETFPEVLRVPLVGRLLRVTA